MLPAARSHLLAHTWVVALLAPLLMAAACFGAVAFDMAWLAGQSPAALNSSQVVSLCVSVRLSGNWRAAAWWESAISTRTGRVRRPFVQPRLACGLIPWQAWLPSTGTLQTSD